MKCQVCAQETIMPFRCPFCGGQFCSAHRLPESHSCPGIAAARAQKRDQVMTQQGPNSYNYSYVFGQQPFKRQNRVWFSRKEFRHIGIAALLVIGIGFSIGWYGNFFSGFSWTLDVMGVFAVIMTASFLVHEIAHKVIAQKSGLWAEFRLTLWGAVLTLASVFLPFKIIAPGAMMIGGSQPSAKDIVRISVAGPLTNIVFASVLLGLAFALLPFTVPFASMMLFAAYINAFMAVFNLIPFGVLDGLKIFTFNKKVWAVMFVPSIILAIVTYLKLLG